MRHDNVCRTTQHRYGDYSLHCGAQIESTAAMENEANWRVGSALLICLIRRPRSSPKARSAPNF
jgi:hypothetical protein